MEIITTDLWSLLATGADEVKAVVAVTRGDKDEWSLLTSSTVRV